MRIHYKIQPKKLKAKPIPTLKVQISGLHSFNRYLLHLVMKIPNAITILNTPIIQISLKFIIAQLVAVLILTIVLAVLLDGVVGEMDVFVVEVG